MREEEKLDKVLRLKIDREMASKKKLKAEFQMLT